MINHQQTRSLRYAKRQYPALISVMAMSFFLIALNCGTAAAEEIEYVEVPPPPAHVEHEEPEDLQPDVTIIQKEDATVEEYRVNGRLYMVKITPVIGKPYYLVDKNGDGLMEDRMNDLQSEPRVPQWVILSW